MICASENLLFFILIKFRWFCFHLHLFQGVLTIQLERRSSSRTVVILKCVLTFCGKSNQYKEK